MEKSGKVLNFDGQIIRNPDDIEAECIVDNKKICFKHKKEYIGEKKEDTVVDYSHIEKIYTNKDVLNIMIKYEYADLYSSIHLINIISFRTSKSEEMAEWITKCMNINSNQILKEELKKFKDDGNIIRKDNAILIEDNKEEKVVVYFVDENEKRYCTICRENEFDKNIVIYINPREKVQKVDKNTIKFEEQEPTFELKFDKLDKWIESYLEQADYNLEREKAIARKENIKNFLTSEGGITLIIFGIIDIIFTIGTWNDLGLWGIIAFPVILIVGQFLFSVKSATWEAENAHRSDIKDLKRIREYLEKKIRIIKEFDIYYNM